jgi:hypothetical protein
VDHKQDEAADKLSKAEHIHLLMQQIQEKE